MKDLSPTVGARIRAARERSGETQQSLATKAGLAVKTLSRAESDGGVQLSTLTAIAEALGITIGDLLADPADAA